MSVVVPTFHRPDALRLTLMALLAQDYDPSRYELLIVDDGGGDDARAVSAELARDTSSVAVTVLRQDRRGVCTARNQGAHRATGDLLLFVDDDVIVATDHLRRHVAGHAELGGRILLNGSWEFLPQRRTQLQATPFGRYRLKLDQRYRADLEPAHAAPGRRPAAGLSSHDFSIASDLFTELGGFDERIPRAGAEDQEFAIRALAAGCRIVLDPSIRTLHNTDWTSLRAFCDREERAAANLPYLARIHPQQYAGSAYVKRNSQPVRGDGTVLIATKLTKRMLATTPALMTLHAGVDLAERVGVADRVLERAYGLLLAAHVSRGFRAGMRDLEHS